MDSSINPEGFEKSQFDGAVCWEAPSNIALVKYWGKYAEQLPCNPSLSMTLKNSKTITSFKWHKKTDAQRSHQVCFDYFFEGKLNHDFAKKINKFLERAYEFIPEINDYYFEIHSHNTFPHSAGIASSASSMAALTLCLFDFQSQINDSKGLSLNCTNTLKKISSLARLGSGSACRSLFEEFVSWGDQSLEYANPLESVDNNFKDWMDSILIVDSSQKSVSSREGHSLMNNHAYSKVRFEQARNNFNSLKKALIQGDIVSMCEITKKEAWELHALMMTANPPFCLMRPNSLRIIELLNDYSKNWDFPWTFTLDAGPNIHLLYPAYAHDRVRKFIQENLVNYLDNKRWIEDQIGQGPMRTSWKFEATE